MQNPICTHFDHICATLRPSWRQLGPLSAICSLKLVKIAPRRLPTDTPDPLKPSQDDERKAARRKKKAKSRTKQHKTTQRDKGLDNKNNNQIKLVEPALEWGCPRTALLFWGIFWSKNKSFNMVW